MASQENPRLWRRLWRALGRAVRCGILGKASRAYMKQFSGGDEYWQAFQRSWLQNQPAEPSPEPEYEPVHGWTTRQLADYLARNPRYRSTYEAELRNGSLVAQTRHKGHVEENSVMLTLRQIEQDILASGKVDGPVLEGLRRQLYGHGKIDRRGADFLVELHKRVQHMTPAFEQFFYQAIKDHILAQDRIDAEQTAWLRRMLFADGKIKDEERKLLHELNGEAGQVSPEFEMLFAESMKQPQEQHTCG